MKICFHLDWIKDATPAHRAFKNKTAYDLISDYVKRIQPYTPCELQGAPRQRPSSSRVWMCDPSAHHKAPSSEVLAEKLQEEMESGFSSLNIVIGGPDGFDEDKKVFWKSDYLWSFGPLTLPHELAAIVASEQIYRAWTILKGHPYHLGH